MSLIPCTDPCIYQQDGCCTLARAVSGGTPDRNRGCIHFLPRGEAALPQHGQRVSDVADGDQL